MAKMMVEDHSRTQPTGSDKRTDDAMVDIKDAFPQRFAREWKCYEGRKEVPATVIAEWKRSGKRAHDLLGNDFDATNPCPAPIKINKDKGWTPDNVKDCGFIVTGCTGKTALARACIHAEEHYDWWLDLMTQEYRDTHDGKDGPPMTTKITLPQWQDADSNLPLGASAIEQKIAEQRRMMEEGYVEEEEVGEPEDLKPKAKGK